MKVAILGASGLVGRTMLNLLESRPWLDGPPRLLVSGRSAGMSIPFRGRELVCEETTADALVGLDVLLCSAGKEAARQWAPVAAQSGALVVDNSSCFRQESGIPLVVPEINPQVGADGLEKAGRIIANPNCSTIQIAMFAAPLDRVLGLRELHATTFQAVSGAGQKALDTWHRQESGAAPGDTDIFPRSIAHNVLPAIGGPLPDGSFEEEAKVAHELRRILGRDQDLAVTCTAVRVPVRCGHSVALRCLFREVVAMEVVHEALGRWPGLRVAKDPHDFETPREIAGDTSVHVGRLRLDPGNARGLLAWVVADNLLKGAAWNAVQIVETYFGINAPAPGATPS